MNLINVSKSKVPSLVDDMFRSFFDEPVQSNTNTWRPSMDVKELEKEYDITFSMPGFKKDEIRVSMKNNTLTVTGEHQSRSDGEGKEYLYREIAYGKYERSLYLPENVDVNQVQATYEDGLLKLSIAKKKEALPKEIAVKVS